MLRHTVVKEGMIMKSGMIGLIVVLVLILVIILSIYLGIRYLRNKTREFSRMMFGTDNLREGIRRQEAEYASAPKSVSGATSLYLPQIMRDFPEFHLDEIKRRAEWVLRAYLQGINEENPSVLDTVDVTEELKDKLSMKIRALQNDGCHERFEQIKIHRTEIHRYRKEKGRTSIVFQSSVGHITYLEKDGKLIRGKKDRLTQNRYNVELCYIQDRALVNGMDSVGYSMICPNCGGAINILGDKECPYCGSAVKEFNIKVWYFHDVQAVK